MPVRGVCGRRSWILLLIIVALSSLRPGESRAGGSQRLRSINGWLQRKTARFAVQAHVEQRGDGGYDLILGEHRIDLSDRMQALQNVPRQQNSWVIGGSGRPPRL
jgi:hypothetical protein